MRRRPDPRHHLQADRPIKGSSNGHYNLNFIDWNNEFEAVCDHVDRLHSNIKAGEGRSYEEQPYFDVPYEEVKMFFESGEGEEEAGEGMSEAQIRGLRQWRGTMKTCSICLEMSAEGLVLPCGHIFHRNCVTRWLRSHTA